jgi:tRNA dimethylallyltransferase
MGQKWHVNDIRKVRRSLEVFYTTGEPHSTIMAGQSNSLTPRFKTCVIWPSADLDVLGPRLDDRVTDMIEVLHP